MCGFITNLISIILFVFNLIISLGGLGIIIAGVTAMDSVHVDFTPQDDLSKLTDFYPGDLTDFEREELKKFNEGKLTEKDRDKIKEYDKTGKHNLTKLIDLANNTKTDIDKMNDYMDKFMNAPAIVLIIFGAVIFIVGYCGCYGTFAEDDCMLCCYVIILSVLLLMQIAIVILIIIYKGTAKDYVSKEIKERYEDYSTDNATKVTIETIQQSLECCGSVDTDTPWNKLNMPAPKSCYPKTDNTKKKFEKSCQKYLFDLVEDRLSLVTIPAVVVAVIEGIAIALAIYVLVTMKPTYPTATPHQPHQDTTVEDTTNS